MTRRSFGHDDVMKDNSSYNNSDFTNKQLPTKLLADDPELVNVIIAREHGLTGQKLGEDTTNRLHAFKR